MLKQWIRQRKISKLSVDPNDPTLRCPPEDEDEEHDADDDGELRGVERVL